MQSLLQDGEYQVMKILDEGKGYQACLCINIESNDNYRSYLLNIYESPETVRLYLPVYYQMQGGPCSDFVKVLTAAHSITAVFEYNDGVPLREFFSRLDNEDFETRLYYTEQLFQKSLILDLTEDFIAYSVLRPNRIVIDGLCKTAGFQYIVPIQNKIPKGFKAAGMFEILSCIFVKQRFVPDDVFVFLNSLREEQTERDSLAALYARWKHLLPELEREYKRLKGLSLPAYILERIKKRVRAFLKKRFSAKGKTKGGV